MLHAVRDALNKGRKNDGEALAPDLKAVYWAETEGEEKEALRNLRERWETVYHRVIVHREHRAYALLAFLRHSKPIRRYLYTTNQLERVSKEVKRRTKVVEVFWGEEAGERLLYLVLSNLNERLEGRRWRGFAEALMGSYHVAQIYSTRRYVFSPPVHDHEGGQDPWC